MKTLKENFQNDWYLMKCKRKIEIHINTFSFEEMKRLTMENVM